MSQTHRSTRAGSAGRHRATIAVLLGALVLAQPALLRAVSAEPDGAIPEARPLALKHGPLSLSAMIGDGTYGSTSGDYDWYELAGNGGWILTVDIDAEDLGSTLDPKIFIYDSAGTLLASNDDYSAPNKDSFLEHVLPADGTYYVVVTTTGCEPQADPFDASSGLCTPALWTHGPYFVVLALSGVHP